MGKKNLEQLFKEAFEDFNETPPKEVWKSIEATLDGREQKKKTIPNWWQLGGIAAALTFLFYAINLLDGTNETLGKDVITSVGAQQNDPVKENAPAIENPKIGDKPENRIKTKLSNQALDTKEIGPQRISTANAGRAAFRTLAIADAKKPIIEEAVAQVEKNTPLKDVEQGGLNSGQNKTVPNKDTEAANSSDNDTKDGHGDRFENMGPPEKKVVEKIMETEAVTQNGTRKDLEKEQPEKKSIFKVLEEQKTREKKTLAENKGNKWSIGPSVAPVYFNGAGEGSPIHSNFSANPKSGNVNLSYGLTFTYSIGKRLKARTGVHRVDYGYDTKEIVFSSSLKGSTNELIDNIDYTQTSGNLVVQSKNNISTVAGRDALVEFATSKTPALEGRMVQQLGYVEVPLELNYALIDQKFGVDFIGGISSLFLVDNTVLLESEGLVTEMGEANNANSVNFSANAGIGFNYGFSPKVQLNLEPVFKYQLNTFSETAGSFRPFSIGFYSGVRFKF